MSTSRSARALFTATTVLMLAAAPAMAQELERVEVRGRIVEATPHLDVHAACTGMDEHLQRTLARTWAEESRYGEVKVQLVLENGEVGAVTAKGISNTIARKVKNAVHHLACAPQTAGAQVYRFSVDFIDPDAPAQDTSDTRTAARRAIRING